MIADFEAQCVLGETGMAFSIARAAADFRRQRPSRVDHDQSATL